MSAKSLNSLISAIALKIPGKSLSDLDPSRQRLGHYTLTDLNLGWCDGYATLAVTRESGSEQAHLYNCPLRSSCL